MKKNFFRQLIILFFPFFFFLNINLNYSVTNSKIYLDLANLVFEHDINYKLHQISSQLLIKTNLDQEIEKWAKEKFVLKGNSGKLKIKIKQEKIFDNFFQEHADKFSFVPKDGISYKIIFKVIVLAENNKHNAYAKIESKITGKRTFLGNFSINDRSKGIDQSIKKMIVKLENNIEDEINKKFQDFLTNKYN